MGGTVRAASGGARALVAVLVLASVACAADPPPPIEIEGGALVVRNQTPADWSNVQIFVNDHYSGTAREIAAGSWVRASLGQFTAMHGQKFDDRRTPVIRVVVKATDPSGAPVRLTWGQGGLR